MDLLASLKAEGLHEFANVWICFPSFQVSQLTCNCIAWKAYMFSWGKLRFWPRGGVNSHSFFLSSCRSLSRRRPLPLDLNLFLCQEHYLGLRDEVRWVNIPYPLSESLNPEYPRRDWPDLLISSWTFLGKSGPRVSVIPVQSDLSVGFWHPPPPPQLFSSC